MARGVDTGASPARQVGRGNPLNPGHYTPQPSTSPAPNHGAPISTLPSGPHRASGGVVSDFSTREGPSTVSSERSRQNHLFGKPTGLGDDGIVGKSLGHGVTDLEQKERRAPISGTGQKGDFFGAKPEVIQLAQMKVNTHKHLEGMTEDTGVTPARPASRLVDAGMRFPDTGQSPIASEVKVTKGTKSQVESAFSKQQSIRSTTMATKGTMPLSAGAQGPVSSPRSIAEVASTKSDATARPPRRVEKAFTSQHSYDSVSPRSQTPLGAGTGGKLGVDKGSGLKALPADPVAAAAIKRRQPEGMSSTLVSRKAPATKASSYDKKTKASNSVGGVGGVGR